MKLDTGWCDKDKTSRIEHTIIQKLCEWENVFLKSAIPFWALHLQEYVGKRFSSLFSSCLELGTFGGTYISGLHRLNPQLDSSLKWNATRATLHFPVSHPSFTSSGMFIYIKMHSGISIHFPDTSSGRPETSHYHPDFSLTPNSTKLDTLV